MNETVLKLVTQDIVMDELFPHAPEKVWKTLTSGEQIGRWMMPPTRFEPWFLSKVENGTRLRLVHSGFVVPRNDTAFENLRAGWPKVFKNFETVVAEHD